MIFVSVCLTSLRLIISRSTHVAADGIVPFIFAAEQYSTAYVTHLLYPHLCWWGLRLIPCLGYCKQCCSEHWGTSIFSTDGFLRYMPRSGIVRSYGSSIFSSSLPVCNSSLQCLFLFLYFLCINACIRLPSFSREGQRAIGTLLHLAFFTSLHVLEITRVSSRSCSSTVWR